MFESIALVSECFEMCVGVYVCMYVCMCVCVCGRGESGCVELTNGPMDQFSAHVKITIIIGDILVIY